MVDINQITRILLGLLIVMAIMFIIAYLLKRVRTSNYLGNKAITVLGTLFLGNKERLLLVAIEGQKVLLGVTAQNIQTLLLIEDYVSKSQNIEDINNQDKFQKILRQQKTIC